MEKYTKTSENQDLNDFLLETLAWNNYRQQLLIPNNKELSLFPKYAIYEIVVLQVSYYSEVFSEYAKKIWGFGKNLAKFGIDDFLIVPPEDHHFDSQV